MNADEKEDSDDDTTVLGAGAPGPYVKLTSQLVSLESAAAACGSAVAAFYLQKARMASIKGHASNTGRQADMRGNVLTFNNWKEEGHSSGINMLT